MTDVLTSDRQAKARRMEKAIRGYFDACNTGDGDAVAAYFAPGAVHYFPPDMYSGPFRGGPTIGEKWSWAVRTLGSRWTVEEIICDPDTDRAVIEWTHEKSKTGVVLRGDECVPSAVATTSRSSSPQTTPRPAWSMKQRSLTARPCTARPRK